MRQLAILLCCLVCLLACTEEPLSNLNTEDSRVYLSNYDKKANFASYKTYYLPDTVFVIDGSNIRASTSTNSQKFLTYIAENLKATAFVPTSKHAKPDLGIQISRVSNTKIGKDGNPNIFFNKYWGYPNFADGGYVYPGIYQDYDHADTAWNIELIDLKNAQANGQIKVLWNAQIWGLQILQENDYPLMVNNIFKISDFLPKQ
jgi:hypothetical protein